MAKKILNLATNFYFVSIIHIPKEWNKVVDFLAKWASKGPCGWSVGDWVDLTQEKAQHVLKLIHEDQED